MEGMGEHAYGQSQQGGNDFNEPVLIEAGSRQPDAEEGGIEGMLPADQDDPDESQEK